VTDFLLGAADERTVIVAWIRKHTRLLFLAQALEDQVHNMPLEELRAYYAAVGKHAPVLLNGGGK
jgi:hypothetical protein